MFSGRTKKQSVTDKWSHRKLVTVMKEMILSLAVGSLVVVDGELAEVKSSKGTRGCKGDTLVVLRTLGGAEVTTGWRTPAVKELRIATMTDAAGAFGVELPALVEVAPVAEVVTEEATTTGGVEVVEVAASSENIEVVSTEATANC